MSPYGRKACTPAEKSCVETPARMLKLPTRSGDASGFEGLGGGVVARVAAEEARHGDWSTPWAGVVATAAMPAARTRLAKAATYFVMGGDI